MNKDSKDVVIFTLTFVNLIVTGLLINKVCMTAYEIQSNRQLIYQLADEVKDLQHKNRKDILWY